MVKLRKENKMHRILVVEDQKEISSIVLKYLDHEGFEHDLATNGFDALSLYSKHKYSLILLDVMMPGIDGFDVLKEIRQISDIPIIMLTARVEEIDRIKGFDLGVDDYVLKPFSPKELMRRIQALLRRTYGQTDEIIYKVGELTLYISSMKLFKGEEEISLTATEFSLMTTFMKHKGIVLNREQLISQSFGFDYDGVDRNIDSYIKRLRQKIEDNPKAPKYILSKYGAGYQFGGE